MTRLHVYHLNAIACGRQLAGAGQPAVLAVELAPWPSITCCRHCQRLHKFREVQLRPSVHSGSTASIRTQQSHNTTYGLGPSFTTPVEGANVLPCALLQSLARCSVSGLGAAPWPATEAATGVQGFQGHFCKSKAAGSSASSGGQATGDVIAAGRAGAGTVSEGLEGMEGGSLG